MDNQQPHCDEFKRLIRSIIADRQRCEISRDQAMKEFFETAKENKPCIACFLSQIEEVYRRLYHG